MLRKSALKPKKQWTPQNNERPKTVWKLNLRNLGRCMVVRWCTTSRTYYVGLECMTVHFCVELSAFNAWPCTICMVNCALLQVLITSAQLCTSSWPATHNLHALLHCSLPSRKLLKSPLFLTRHSLFIYASLSSNSYKLGAKYLQRVKLISIRQLWAQRSKYDLIPK